MRGIPLPSMHGDFTDPHLTSSELEAVEAVEEQAGPRRMNDLVLVAVGGCIGAVLRYVVEAAITRRTGAALPWGTMIINVSGAFLLGALTALTVERQILPMWLRPALGVGLLGAYTTFSTLAVDAIVLTESGAVLRAAVYVVATNVAGVAAAALGFVVGRAA